MNISVHEAIRRLLVDSPKALELYNSGQADVTVKIGSKGSIKEVTLTPKNLVNSSDNSSTEMEALSTTVSDEEEIEIVTKVADESEDVGEWWKNDSFSDDDLDFTLEWEDDIGAECNEAVAIPDVFEATQLPPGRMTGILSNTEPVILVEKKNEVLPDSTVPLTEKKIRKKSDNAKKEPDEECWNCKAPKPIHGIYRENADDMRLVFCCDKPTRIKPSKNVIESNLKNYPYHSWVNQSF